MAIGENFKLDLQGIDFLAHEVHCVFFYRQTGGTGGCVELADEFNDVVIPAMVALMSNGAAATIAHCINLNDVTDFVDRPIIGGAGLDAGEDMPPFAAFEFMYHRASRAVRNGYKRTWGLTQNMLENEVIASTFVDEATAIASAFQATLDDGGGNTWTPMIAHRSTGGGTTVYTLYGITGVTYVRCTTQNSRKT